MKEAFMTQGHLCRKLLVVVVLLAAVAIA